jgi:hypothetical protein
MSGRVWRDKQMTRAAEQLWRVLRGRDRRLPTSFWLPRPGYCACCGGWAWLTNERPAYSAYDGAFICEECAVENDKETAAAWAEYYSGRL